MAGLDSIVPEVIVPCEGEKEVKQYHCTHLKSTLLRLKAEGVLQVTNKRIIFRASGKSITGNSIIQSEVPIEDVSGINIYKGTYFSFKYLLLAAIAVFLFNIIFFAFIGVFSIKNYKVASAIQWIFALGSIFGVYSIPRKYIWNSIVGGMGTVSFTMIAGTSFFSGLLSGMSGGYSDGNGKQVLGIFALIMLVYTIVAIILYARRLTMSLAIGSKGGSNTPIYISGVSNFGYANTAAPKALESEPTEETEILIKELGALVMDIQNMGEYGIEKWA